MLASRRDKERIDIFRPVLFIDIPRDRRPAGQYRRVKSSLMTFSPARTPCRKISGARLFRRNIAMLPSVIEPADDRPGIAIDRDIRDRRISSCPAIFRQSRMIGGTVATCRGCGRGRPRSYVPPVSRSFLLAPATFFKRQVQLVPDVRVTRGTPDRQLMRNARFDRRRLENTGMA